MRSPTRSVGARSVVLEAIRALGETSRSDIAAHTGLTGATVSTTIRDLINDGVVEEIGHAESTGGKPRRLLRLARDARHAVGIHLDQGCMRLVLTNLAGDVIASYADEPVEPRGPEASIGLIALRIGELIEQSGVSRRSLAGIGVCSPGPMTPDSDMILSPTGWRQWSPFPFAAALERSAGLPVLVDNDATACAFGEYWTNPVGSRRSGIGSTPAPDQSVGPRARMTSRRDLLATLYMGVGLGGAVIVDGTPFRGASGNSVEIGHTCVDVAGPRCWCGGNGCAEVMGGPHTMVLQAQEQGLIEPTDHGGPVSLLGQFIQLADMAHRGDDRAVALFRQSATYIGVAALTLASMVDPDHIALTGPGFAAAGDLYLPAIEDILHTRYMARASHTIDVWLSRHADEAPAIGVAALVLRSALLGG